MYKDKLPNDQGNSKTEDRSIKKSFHEGSLTAVQLSEILQINKKTIYNQTGKRSQKKISLPVVRVGNRLRFDPGSSDISKG